MLVDQGTIKYGQNFVQDAGSVLGRACEAWATVEVTDPPEGLEALCSEGTLLSVTDLVVPPRAYGRHPRPARQRPHRHPASRCRRCGRRHVRPVPLSGTHAVAQPQLCV